MNKIPLAPRKSTNIKATGYDAATKTLAVQFVNGVVWHYADVPAALAEELHAAPSIGSFFGKKIRGEFESTVQKEHAHV